MDSIEELESYTLFQEINDTFLVISQMISKHKTDLLLKDTFIITLDDELILKDSKTMADVDLIIKWLNDKKQDLLHMINDCIKSTEENFSRFKVENSKIKDEIQTRTKELKKCIKLLNELNLDKPKYEDFRKLKLGPDLNADYAGITVTETKHFII